MEEIGISKLSPAVLGRIRKGSPVRIKGGDDMKLLVDKKSSRKIQNAFSKGKAITKKLSQEELEANAREIKGAGIFGDRFDRYLKKLGDKTGFNLKKHAYKLGDTIKPAVKAGIATALTAGATALTPILAESAPNVIPYLPAVVAGTTKIASDFLDKPSDFGVGSGLYAGSGIYAGKGLYASKLRGSGLYAGVRGSGVTAEGGGFYDAEGTYHPNKAQTTRHNFNKMKKKEIKGTGKKLLDQKFSIKEAIDFFKEDLPNAIQGRGRKVPRNFGGGQIRRNIPKEEEGGSVGLGGTLLHSSEQHPALRSQPYSVHFAWGSTLPPRFQTFNNGLQ
jgi:hypothetical protein